MSAINASVTKCNEYKMIGQSPIIGLLLYPSFIFTYILLTLWAVTYPCILPAHRLFFHNFLLDHQFSLIHKLQANTFTALQQKELF